MSAAVPEAPREARNAGHLEAVPDAPTLGPELFAVGEGDGIEQVLREQLGRLARHYARDVANLRQKLYEARSAETLAARNAERQSAIAGDAIEEANGLRRVLAVTQLQVQEARGSYDRLEAAIDTPWYNFMRRRQALRDARPGARAKS